MMPVKETKLPDGGRVVTLESPSLKKRPEPHYFETTVYPPNRHLDVDQAHAMTEKDALSQHADLVRKWREKSTTMGLSKWYDAQSEQAQTEQDEQGAFTHLGQSMQDALPDQYEQTDAPTRPELSRAALPFHGLLINEQEGCRVVFSTQEDAANFLRALSQQSKTIFNALEHITVEDGTVTFPKGTISESTMSAGVGAFVSGFQDLMGRVAGGAQLRARARQLDCPREIGFEETARQLEQTPSDLRPFERVAILEDMLAGRGGRRQLNEDCGKGTLANKDGKWCTGKKSGQRFFVGDDGEIAGAPAAFVKAAKAKGTKSVSDTEKKGLKGSAPSTDDDEDGSGGFEKVTQSKDAIKKQQTAKALKGSAPKTEGYSGLLGTRLLKMFG